MKHLITVLAYLLAAEGLWSHDWRLILAGAATAAIWPLIYIDLEDASYKAELDRLWDDEAA